MLSNTQDNMSELFGMGMGCDAKDLQQPGKVVNPLKHNNYDSQTNFCRQRDQLMKKGFFKHSYNQADSTKIGCVEAVEVPKGIKIVDTMTLPYHANNEKEKERENLKLFQNKIFSPIARNVKESKDLKNLVQMKVEAPTTKVRLTQTMQIGLSPYK